MGYALLAGVSLVTASVLLCGGMVWQRTVANAHWLSDTVFGVLAGVAATMVVGWLLHDRVEIEQARGWRWVWQQASASSRPLS